MQTLPGFRDFLPADCAQRNYIFAKWREVYNITDVNPTPLGIEANAEALAAYASICQSEGIVPIVEPEVLIDGNHSMARCDEVTEAVLHAVFHALHQYKVMLEYMVLKPSMVLPGKDVAIKATPQQVAAATVRVLRRTVPAAVPGIYFLSGGQRPEAQTANPNAMNVQFADAPWQLSFSSGRPLPAPVHPGWRRRQRTGCPPQRRSRPPAHRVDRAPCASGTRRRTAAAVLPPPEAAVPARRCRRCSA